MEEKFLNFLYQKCRFKSSDKALLAVSGGLDSMVMAALFRTTGTSHGIAHCNFGLRGADSDADEAFVKEYAQMHRIEFFSIRFNPEELRASPGESIQMAARRLRYEWLEKIRMEYGFDQIAVAQHLHDLSETIIYNLTKGCGIRGLHGILPVRERIIRPLLFANRNMLEVYAREKEIPWRLDRSNLEHKYARNLIRAKVIPALQVINPEFEQTMAANQHRFLDVEALMQFAVDTICEKVVLEKSADSFVLDLAALAMFPAATTVLYELIRPFEFSAQQVRDILQLRPRASGAIFLSSKYSLHVHRGKAWIYPKTQELGGQILEIYPEHAYLSVGDGSFKVEFNHLTPEEFPKNPDIAWLDAEKLSWPLRLRHWKPGDWFCPIGMGGKRKKLQDLFSDAGFAMPEKQKVWILETSKLEICWVVGLRSDERFRIPEKSKHCLKITFIKNKNSPV